MSDARFSLSLSSGPAPAAGEPRPREIRGFPRALNGRIIGSQGARAPGGLESARKITNALYSAAAAPGRANENIKNRKNMKGILLTK